MNKDGLICSTQQTGYQIAARLNAHQKISKNHSNSSAFRQGKHNIQRPT